MKRLEEIGNLSTNEQMKERKILAQMDGERENSFKKTSFKLEL